MTCVEVMYQPPGAPGAGFQAYPREPCSVDFSIRHNAQSFARMQEPLDLGASSSFTPVATPSSAHSNSTFTAASTVGSLSSALTSSSSLFPSSSSELSSSRTLPPAFPHPDCDISSKSSPSSLPPSTPSSTSVDVFHQPANTYNNDHYQHHHPHQHHHQQQQNQNHHRSRQPKEEQEKKEVYDEDRKSNPVRTDYFGVNCVLHTFFSGDIRKAVDDHFSRSMEIQSQHQRSRDGLKCGQSIDSLSMAERNLPPSFWNSSYYQLHPQHSHYYSFFDQSGSTGGSNYSYHHPFHSIGAGGSSSFSTGSNISGAHSTDILHGGSANSSAGAGAGLISGAASGNDSSPFHGHPAHPYLTPTLQGLSSLQSAAAAAVNSDPWSAYCNSFASSATAMPYPHRPVPYDLSSYSSSGRFGQKYTSFLMKPSSMRSAHFGAVAGQCDVPKPSGSRSRFSDPRLGGADYPSSHHSSFTAMDATSLQEAPTKDLYWF